jgi:hypothetical protein
MTAPSADIHSGRVICMTGDKLTTCDAGKLHRHTMAKGAKVTCDGESYKAADLKAGTLVKVTRDKEDKSVATHVQCSKQIPTATVEAQSYARTRGSTYGRPTMSPPL